MPPLPRKPIKTPWPTNKCQGRPSDEMARPMHTIAAPNITVHRTPTRSAIRPITMPPTPTPIQPSEPASAGVSRAPPKSAAMTLRETTVTHGAPNEKASVRSATVATTQDVRVSMLAGTDGWFKAAPAQRGRKRLADAGVGTIRRARQQSNARGAGLPHIWADISLRRRATIGPRASRPHAPATLPACTQGEQGRRGPVLTRLNGVGRRLRPAEPARMHGRFPPPQPTPRWTTPGWRPQSAGPAQSRRADGAAGGDQ